MPKHNYFPNLDGLRFSAFMVVFLYHCCTYFKPRGQVNEVFDWIYVVLTLNDLGGQLGVAFFFTLSGFLITHLILKERDGRGKFHVWYFYMRRILRIWPLYFLSLLLGFIVVPILAEKIGVIWANDHANFLNFAFFLANFDIFWNGYPNPSLGVQWSVAIEEQFYIVWPWIFGFINKRLLPVILGLLIGVSIVYLSIGKSEHLHYHSLAALIYLSFGGGLAILARKNWFNKRVENLPKWLNVFYYILGFSFIYFEQALYTELEIDRTKMQGVNAIIYGIFFSFIIAEQNYSKQSLLKFSSAKLLSKWGKNLSYGAYLFHMIPILAVGIFAAKYRVEFSILNFMIYCSISLVLTIVISQLFYWILERPILKVKNKFHQSNQVQ